MYVLGLKSYNSGHGGCKHLANSCMGNMLYSRIFEDTSWQYKFKALKKRCTSRDDMCNMRTFLVDRMKPPFVFPTTQKCGRRDSKGLGSGIEICMLLLEYRGLGL